MVNSTTNVQREDKDESLQYLQAKTKIKSDYL